jgi:hypothetical protein
VRRITELVLLVCGLCSVGMCQYATVFSSYYGNKRYDFPITPERLAKSPPWLEEQPNPPLPARSALATAVGYLGTLFPDAGRWKPAAITLVPVRDRWVYSIEFNEPSRSGCAECFSTSFRVVVMMDGAAVTAVQPM